MGFKYILYRTFYEIIRKSGLIRKSFPTHAPQKHFIDLDTWRLKARPFFFWDVHNYGLSLDNNELQRLSTTFKNLKNGLLVLFSGKKCENAFNNWHQNPENNFIFDKDQHWTEINEFATGQGDIKYVWEKGRFCFLYSIIRYDYYHKEDNSDFVFSLILSWIKSTKLNCGPHYKCSQEISIRILNWIFALYYYHNSVSLNNDTFNLILNSIYTQAIHIQKNLSFSSIAVRNNHIISEALGLYAVGLLFPWFPESMKWRNTGKSILEREGLYQIYRDGSYLQHSSNYHRAVLQLYTWALRLAELNEDSFSDRLKKRLLSSVNFMYSLQDQISGKLPNYGANDGTLFFPLNSCLFSDFRPQIDAINAILTHSTLYEKGKWNEDIFWYGITLNTENRPPFLNDKKLSFKNGGYFVLRTDEMRSVIRCASFNHRPSHSDNLHLDLWYNGSNIICDRGSYSYNATSEILSEFLPASVHNTVTVDDYDQMLKGPRFIWYFWPKAIYHQITECSDYLEFSGKIKAFLYLKRSGIFHYRAVKHFKNIIKWEITDKLENWNGEITQHWNIGENFDELGFKINSTDGNGMLLNPDVKTGLSSITYGIKHSIKQLVFKTNSNIINTIIEKK